MNKTLKKRIALCAVFYCFANLPSLRADTAPQPYGSGNQQQPEISASMVSTGTTNSTASDATANFLNNNPLSQSSAESNPIQQSLTQQEAQNVMDLMNNLMPNSGGAPLPPPPRIMPSDSSPPTGPGSAPATIETSFTEPILDPTATPANNPTAVPEPKRGILNPFSLLINEYSQVKKKIQGPDFETLLKDSQLSRAENTPFDLGGPLPKDIQNKALVKMNLNVTDAVVKASENFKLSDTHPFMDWLAMSGVAEESKKALSDAEAQRKAMADAVKEAEKNGNRIFFIVNGKLTPFFFNIPLFMKGAYQLYILDETSFPTSLPS